MIPEYINCQTNEEPCDYLMVKECKNTCPYAKSLGIGAITTSPKNITKELTDKLFEEDMRDY